MKMRIKVLLTAILGTAIAARAQSAKEMSSQANVALDKAEKLASQDNVWAGFFLEDYRNLAQQLGRADDTKARRKRWLDASLARMRDDASRGVFYTRLEFIGEHALELGVPLATIFERIQEANKIALDVREKQIIQMAHATPPDTLEIDIAIRRLASDMQSVGMPDISIQHDMFALRDQVSKAMPVAVAQVDNAL